MGKITQQSTFRLSIAHKLGIEDGCCLTTRWIWSTVSTNSLLYIIRTHVFEISEIFDHLVTLNSFNQLMVLLITLTLPKIFRSRPSYFEKCFVRIPFDNW